MNTNVKASPAAISARTGHTTVAAKLPGRIAEEDRGAAWRKENRMMLAQPSDRISYLDSYLRVMLDIPIPKPRENPLYYPAAPK